MRVALVFCAIVALAAAASVPEFFASQRMVRDTPPVAASNLFTGTFFTRQDHTRPQNRDLALFVSFNILFF